MIIINCYECISLHFIIIIVIRYIFGALITIYDRLHCNTAGAGSMTVPKLNSPAPGPVIDSETGMGHKDTIADSDW